MLSTASALAAAKKQLRQEMKLQLAALPPTAIAEQSRSSSFFGVILTTGSTIFHALLAFAPYVRARRVAVFLSMPTAEIQTDAIVRHALAAGKHVFVPYLHRPVVPAGHDPPPMARVMDMVRLHGAADYDLLVRDRWGIPSVDPDSVHARPRILGDGMLSRSPYDESSSASPSLDLVLLPGVAFDVDPATGCVRRCGHGRGFYDFFLHRYARHAASSAGVTGSVSSDSSAADTRPHLCGLALAEQVLPGPAGPCVPTGPYDEPLDSLVTGTGAIVTSGQKE